MESDPDSGSSADPRASRRADPAEAERETRLTPSEAVEHMRINVPVRGNESSAA